MTAWDYGIMGSRIDVRIDRQASSDAVMQWHHEAMIAAPIGKLKRL